MSWDDFTLFLTSDLLAREGELLDDLPFINRHEVVKHIIGERIIARFNRISEPLVEIANPQLFAETALCLNLAMVLRENSTRRDDIFAVRAEFYQRRFEEELERAFAAVKFDEAESGVELVR